MTTKREMKKEIIELGTGLPFQVVADLDDDNPSVEVDWSFLRMVITRLRELKKIAPDHLAEADIPRTMEFINRLTPPKGNCPECQFESGDHALMCSRYKQISIEIPHKGDW